MGVWQIYRKVRVKVAGAQRSCVCHWTVFMQCTHANRGTAAVRALGSHSAATSIRCGAKTLPARCGKRPEVSEKKVD